MADAVWAMIVFFGLYPMAVLCVAATGPHSEAERAELRRYQLEAGGVRG